MANTQTNAAPVAVEVTRGAAVESRHRASAVVADAAGAVVRQWGDIDQAVFPRSAIKPLQALPLIESGAAEHYDLGDGEIALACASHGAEGFHTETIEAWLARIGLGEADLECGAHLPSHQPSLEALLRGGGAANQTHNNCSGKHLGFLTTARHLGEPTKGYIRIDHPVQRRVIQVFGEMSGLDMSRAAHGADGCGIPTLAVPLRGIAVAMARFADPEGLAPERKAAARRIARAMTARPEMVSGSGRFCSAIIGESRQGRLGSRVRGLVDQPANVPPPGPCNQFGPWYVSVRFSREWQDEYRRAGHAVLWQIHLHSSNHRCQRRDHSDVRSKPPRGSS